MLTKTLRAGLSLRFLGLKFDRLYKFLKQHMLTGLIQNLGDVQVNPKTVYYKLGIHILLLHCHTSKRRNEELKITGIADLRRNEVPGFLPGRIPQLLDHIATGLAVFAV